MPSCSSEMPSSNSDMTIASLGTPRILVGFNSESFFGETWPSQ